jgi:uncharacterized protein (TIGR03663 family)
MVGMDFPNKIEQDVDISSAERLSILKPKALVITWETTMVLALAGAALVSRLWMLGARVMSHDESLHVYYSWLLATGKGFTHNPMMHGPFLFEATALMDIIFGASDFSSRLVPAILGISIVIFVPQLLKPWLGRFGALGTSVFLLISPFVLYFSRYIRHDIQVIAWTLLAIIAILRYLADRNEHDLILLTVALALMLSTMEITFIYLAILASFLVLNLTVKHRFSWKAWREAPEFDLLVILTTLGAFFSSSIALLLLNPLWNKLTGSPFVDLQVLSAQSIDWATGNAGIRILGLFALFSLGAATLGLWWNRIRWLKIAGLFALITIPLFTTFFTNPAGIGTGFIGSLGYWLSQQGVARGSQPWYYYLIVFPFYEYLPLFGSLLAAIFFTFQRKTIIAGERIFVLFLFWWAAWILTGLTLAGEKMPWLSTHIAMPFILLTGWLAGRLCERIFAPAKSAGGLKAIIPWVALVLIGILSIATIRTSIAANFNNYDYSTEFIDYAHGAPGVKWALNDITDIANHTGAGKDLKIAYDDEVSWPMTWYLRDYRNQAFYGAEPNRQSLDAPVVIAGPKNWTKVEAILGNRYHRFELIRMWWPIEDYKNLTWERIRPAIIDPAMRAALWDIFWNRDYRSYANLTGQSLNPPANWPLKEQMRIYVKKDIAVQMLSLSLGPNMITDIPAPVDTYESIRRSEKPIQVFSDLGFNAPRGVALARNGSMYVADTGNSRIVQLDSDGQMINTWGTRTPDGQSPPSPGTFIEPWGIALDAQGNVYVADTWNHRIQKFDQAGKFLLEWGHAGQPSDGTDGFWGPRGIAIGTDGRVYVTDTGNKRVLVFDANGKFLLEFNKSGGGSLDEPVGIALGQNGQVYIADTWDQRVAIFSTDGQFKTSWPVLGWNNDSLNNKPYLALDAQGRVYITDPEGYRVIVFSPDGKPLAAFGQAGPEQDAFGLPAGITSGLDGTLWVVDAGNNRLEKFAPIK